MFGKLGLSGDIGPVRIFQDRLLVLRARRSWFKMMKRFADAPAVIPTFSNQINLFPQILANITRPEIPGLAIETESPDVPQAVRPDFLPCPQPGHVRFSDKRVVRWNAVSKGLFSRAYLDLTACVDINAHYFCCGWRGVLAVRERIARQAPIPQGNI